MEEANKAKRVACSDDMFSNLSDELICHILSFMSTEEAYRTSVLSKRWALISTMILDLTFNLPKLPDGSVVSKETQSVYASLLKRSRNIRKLSLTGQFCCQPHDVHMWISKALDLNLQRLRVELALEKTTFLPLRLSTSESLVFLKLEGKIQFKLDSSSKVHFPSLRILHLKGIVKNSIVEYHSEFDLGFLSGCPRLVEFFLSDDNFRQELNISFPSLKRLYLDFPQPVCSRIKFGTTKINLLSSLEILDIVDHSARKYEFINFANVDRARLSITGTVDSRSNLYTLLNGLSNVKSLTLDPLTVMFLSRVENLDKLSLVTFNNLLSLSVEIVFMHCSWNMLVSFLQTTPNLKDLSIKRLEKGNNGNSRWEEPSITPTCLLTSLITFKFEGIEDIKTEYDFTRYIIERSSKLEKVKISRQVSKKKTMSLLETNVLKGLKKKPFILVLEG